jgi:hypothetical protein
MIAVASVDYCERCRCKTLHIPTPSGERICEHVERHEAPAERWRVGNRVPEHVYIGDRPLVTMPTAALAALVVDAVNERGRR